MIQWSIRTTQRARDALTTRAAAEGKSVGVLLDEITQPSGAIAGNGPLTRHRPTLTERLDAVENPQRSMRSTPQAVTGETVDIAALSDHYCAHDDTRRLSAGGLRACNTCGAIRGTDLTWRMP